jgi:hypothetical protein
VFLYVLGALGDFGLAAGELCFAGVELAGAGGLWILERVLVQRVRARERIRHVWGPDADEMR